MSVKIYNQNTGTKLDKSEIEDLNTVEDFFGEPLFTHISMKEAETTVENVFALIDCDWIPIIFVEEIED